MCQQFEALQWNIQVKSVSLITWIVAPLVGNTWFSQFGGHFWLCRCTPIFKYSSFSWYHQMFPCDLNGLFSDSKRRNCINLIQLNFFLLTHNSWGQIRSFFYKNKCSFFIFLCYVHLCYLFCMWPGSSNTNYMTAIL